MDKRKLKDLKEEVRESRKADKNEEKEDEDEEEEEEDEDENSHYRLTSEQRRSLKLNKDTINAIKDVFRSLDKDESGTLEVEELEVAMKSMGVECERKELEDLMVQVDKDGNGSLDVYEFSQMVSGKLREYDPEKELKEAFAVFDQNGDGHITADEIKCVVESLGGTMTNEELQSMLQEADDNSDGYLDYDEFVRIWIGEDKKEEETPAETPSGEEVSNT